MATNRFSDIETSFKRLTPLYGYHSEKLVSIEKALEPIEPLIDQLPYYIKIAKKSCCFPSKHGLSHDQSAAIFIYTMEWGDNALYCVLNKALRSENRQELKVWFPYLKLFDTALDLLPTVQETLWRGVPLDLSESFKKNQIITWWSVNSCSSSVSIIKSFLNSKESSTLFLIESIHGKRISGYTNFENEDEIILRMGTQFRVKSDPLQQSKNSIVVHLIEIDPENEESNQIPGILDIPADARWSPQGITVAGGQKRGTDAEQLWNPLSIFIDDDQTIFVADMGNHRVMQWKKGDASGQIVAGGQGRGNHLNQLSSPSAVWIDKETNSILISDRDNRRIMKWSCRNDTTHGEILIENINCYGLAMDEQRYLYVTDTDKHEVRRYTIERDDRRGTVVAGGHGKGEDFNQLNNPRHIFIDAQQNVYVSDNDNYRVMKWNKDKSKGIIVAGGQGNGTSLIHLSYPCGLFVDASGTVYVTEFGNARVTRWHQGQVNQGSIVAGGNGSGANADQLNGPAGLSFDKHGHLYVADCHNHRIQRFSRK